MNAQDTAELRETIHKLRFEMAEMHAVVEAARQYTGIGRGEPRKNGTFAKLCEAVIELDRVREER